MPRFTPLGLLAGAAGFWLAELHTFPVRWPGLLLLAAVSAWLASLIGTALCSYRPQLSDSWNRREQAWPPAPVPAWLGLRRELPAWLVLALAGLGTWCFDLAVKILAAKILLFDLG